MRSELTTQLRFMQVVAGIQLLLIFLSCGRDGHWIASFLFTLFLAVSVSVAAALFFRGHHHRWPWQTRNTNS